MEQSDGIHKHFDTTDGSPDLRLREVVASTHKLETLDQLQFAISDEDALLLSKLNMEGVKIEGNSLVLASLATKNQLTADYHIVLFNSLDDKSDLQAFQQAHQIWGEEIGSNDMASGRFMVGLNNARDVFTMASKLLISNTMQAFHVFHVVEAALKHIDSIEPGKVIQFWKVHHGKAEGDIANGMIPQVLAERLKETEGLCIEFLDAIALNLNEELHSLYFSAFYALSQVNPNKAFQIGLKDAESEILSVQNVAIVALGRMASNGVLTESQLNTLVEKLKDKSQHNGNAISPSIIEAIVAVATHSPIMDDVVTGLVSSEPRITLSLLSNLFFRQSTKLKDRIHFKTWIKALAQISANEKGLINSLDWILHALMQDPNFHEFVVECIATWVLHVDWGTTNLRFVEVFDSTFLDLASNKDLLSRLYTSWLIADDSQLPFIAAEILRSLSVHDIKEVGFYLPTLDALDDAELILLMRRMLGHIVNESQLIHLTLSLVNSNKNIQRNLSIVADVLANDVGLNYPDETLDQIEKIKSTSQRTDIIELCNQISTSIKSYIDQIEALPRLQEFRPSPRLETSFAQARAKAMDDGMREVRKKSIWQQIVKQVPIKSGGAVFTYRDENYSEPSRMTTLGASMALPRGHINDEIGYEIGRYRNQNAKRGKN